ncbi:response regulator [Halonotius terrestris]|uniref:Response regulator n=1 Tax=Halonotius terrestris TaxID=2487750 RepID=A0A8J8TCG5_9EURY|nr:bacterio-opsin activator domain-containing protein [Halonotius terrestris]TQQ81203.1 response regulator [Halonotius terrestris]
MSDETPPTAVPATAPSESDEEIRVLLVDDDEDFVTLAATLLEAESDRIATTTETDPQVALDATAFTAIDCVVSDYRMPEMDGIEFLETVRAEYPQLPFILFTGKGDEEVAKRAIAADVSDYIVKDGSAEQYAISANRIENLVSQYRTRQAARHKQALDTLGQAVLQTVLEGPTREAIETGVCDRLVESDLYDLAWIGERDAHSGEITVRAQAGDGDLVDGVEFRTDHEPRTVEEHALADAEPRIETGLSTAGDDEGWTGVASEAGFDAAIGVPIVHEEVPYGVLGIYTARRGEISAAERETLTDLADLTAFAIGASERRRGDTSQQVVEIEFDVTHTEFPFVTLADRLGCGVELAQTTYRTDGTALTLYRLAGDPPDDIDGLAASLDAESVEVVEGDSELSVVSATPWWDDLTGLYGANIAAATAGDGGATLRLELPPSAEVRSVVDHIEARYPGLELVARQKHDRAERSIDDLRGLLDDALTDRQREVIETAYHAGYYEWPHEASSEDVANLLGIAQPTFAEHFWTAQRRIADQLFDDDSRHGDE